MAEKPKQSKSRNKPDPACEKTVADPRVMPDRRKYAKTDTGLERRRGPGRRRADNLRSAEEGEMTKEQFLFLMAIDAFKKANSTTFPTWTDVLEIVRRLGYRKVNPSEINLPNAEDWLESPTAPAVVEGTPIQSEKSVADEFNQPATPTDLDDFDQLDAFDEFDMFDDIDDLENLEDGFEEAA